MVTADSPFTTNQFQELLDAQKARFASGVTRTHEWRIDQLDRMKGMLVENEQRFQDEIARDFKTASEEKIFETFSAIGEVEFQRSQLKGWMEPVEVPVPKTLAASRHQGVVYREPYGVALVVGPFNGPLTLLIRPALATLAAGNTCVLAMS